MTMKTKIEIWKSDATNDYHWHALRSGRIVACAGEGYKRRIGCVKSLNRFIDSIKAGRFVIEKE